MSLFEKGREKTGGRASGTRNKFSKKFDDALLRDFEEHGEDAIKIARIERPTEYLKLIASRFPIEFQFTDSRLKELSDDELDAFMPLSEANSAVLLQTLTAEKTRRSTENRLGYYSPYPKQVEFHSAGAPDSRIDALLLLLDRK